MVPYLAEIVTITAIAAILAVYLILLRKNGWLGGGASDLYRCPNQHCKRVFQNPVEMKDLSEEPVRVYPACPHCGNDLGPLLESLDEKSKGYKPAVRPQKPQAQTKASAPTIEVPQPKIEQRENSQLHVPKPVETTKAEINVDKSQPILTTLQAPKPPSESPPEPEVVAKKPQVQTPSLTVAKEVKADSNAKGSEDKQAVCAHFFGYLHTLHKAALIPNACYSCPKIVDCYCKDTESGITA